MARNLKFYLSGAISNDKDFRPKFTYIEHIILCCFHKLIEVVNPVTIAEQLEKENGESSEKGDSFSLDYSEYMKADLGELIKCDAIVMLPNWRKSRGAKFEKELAKICNIPIYYVAKGINKMILKITDDFSDYWNFKDCEK